MRRFFAAAVALALTGAAFAKTENFDIQGAGPNGVAYSGKVALTEIDLKQPTDGDVFSVVWTIGQQQVKGIGIVHPDDRNTLSVAYLTDDGKPAIAIYRQANGAIAGIWWLEGFPGVGTESWTPAK